MSWGRLLAVGGALLVVSGWLVAKPLESSSTEPPLWLPLPGAGAGVWFINEADHTLRYCRPDQVESTKIVCHSTTLKP